MKHSNLQISQTYILLTTEHKKISLFWILSRHWVFIYILHNILTFWYIRLSAPFIFFLNSEVYF